MKQLKRAMAFLLTFVLLLSSTTTIPVFAADAKEKSAGTVISVESKNAVPGGKVSIDVKIKNNPGILGATLQISYDEGLTLTEVAGGDAFSYLTLTKPSKLNSNCKFIWDGQDCKEEDIKDGTILTLTFEVSKDVQTKKPLNVKAEIADGDFYDNNLNYVEATTESGSITALDFTPGDLNGDGKINIKDVVLIRRYIIGDYDTKINENAANVNDDGKVNSADVILLRRYIAGGYGVELKAPSSLPCEHTMEQVAYKSATCTEEGNSKYWKCTTCGKYFSDVYGNHEITLESTVIPATGHTIVIDKAVEPTYTSTGLTEGSHCSVCGTVLKKQEEIPALQKKTYPITYHISDGDSYLSGIKIENPNPTSYTSEDGLKLANVKADGYIFEGWYDGEGSNAELVKEIKAGEKGSRELYARWSLREYTIQFDSPLVPVSSIKYTVDKGVTLSNPDWFGYTFAGWSDENGKIVKSIKAGTTGNIRLYANWTSKRNQTVPVSKLDEPIIEENSEQGVYLFAYEIGRIENVPLYTIKDFGNRSGITVTETTSTSGSISETSANTIAEMISNATTRSDSWSLSEAWNESTTISQEHSSEVSKEDITSTTDRKDETGKWSISSGDGGTEALTTEFGTSAKIGAKIGTEVGGTKIAPVKVTAELNGEAGTTSKDTESNSRTWNTNEGYEGSSVSSSNTVNSSSLSSKISDKKGYSQTKAHNVANSSTSAVAVSQSTSREYASSLSYATAKTETSVKEYTNKDAPEGYYRLVAAGTVHVFAVVGYDIATKSYFTYTYNILDDQIKDFIDYSKSTSNFDDYENGVLPFDVPYEVNEYINNVINASYGLVVDTETGKIVAYNGEATSVFVPEYMPVDNGDGTTSVVKVTGFNADAFKGNTNITSIKFSKYITEIPDSAFEGCTALQKIECPSLTSIGKNAFAGCTSLEEFTVTDKITNLGTHAFDGVSKVTINAVSAEVAEGAVQAGAKQLIVSNVSDGSFFENETITIPNSTEYFEFNGANKTYNGLRIVSDAGTTVINGVEITNSTGIPLKLSSSNVTLNRTTVNAPGYAMVLSSDATVALYGTVNLNTEDKNAVLCKNVSLVRANPQAVGKLNVSGNIMVCGTIDDQGMLNVSNGEIITINEESYEKLAQDTLDWVLESEVPEGATVVGEKWTYDFTTTTTSNQDTLEGYTLYDTSWQWGNYGNWSGWSRTAYSNSESRQVESTTVTDQNAYTSYNYYYYRYWNSGAGKYYYTYSSSMGGTKYTMSLNYQMQWKGDYSGHAGYVKPGGGHYNFSGELWFLEYTNVVPAVTHTEWRYRDRQKVYTYYFKKVEQQESATKVEESDTISNVQRWVQYVN